MMLGQYFHVFLFALVGVGLGAAILFAARLLREYGSKKDLTAYECGMPAVGSAWISPNIRFYVFALLFVVFDVEALFVFPWAVRFRELGLDGFLAVMVFVGILFLGLVYAWRKGALRWE